MSKKRKRWFCDACECAHNSTTSKNTTGNGLNYCDKWEEMTSEDLLAGIEDYLETAVSWGSGTAPTPA